MKPVKMIFATDDNNVFGNTDNTLPFKCKADMEHFKEYTKGHIVVMGVNTFKSLPKKLEGRVNVVYASLSRGFDCVSTLNGEKPDLFINSDLYEVAEIPAYLDHLAHTFDGDIIFIGGTKLLLDAFTSGIVQEVSMTLVDGVHDGDIDCNELVDAITVYDTSNLESLHLYFKEGCTVIIQNHKDTTDEKHN
jgi:dihydrofolate reductase